ncbi:MAG: hypothetical protein KIH08_03380 [Candidatus Freyarchaeota archaeon]|nr:hypothetical protein [Candidatus Jordarchaeia archaeon]MBS7279305.1 hypothetical protein [Candidatus Jordarchaeia archaeon]
MFLARCVDDGTLNDFYLVDVHIHLGVERGPPIRNYNRDNFFKFCQSVEKAFFKELSGELSLKYRLEGNSAPSRLVGFPLLLEGEKNSQTLFDEFFVAPYVSKIASISVDHVKVENDEAQVLGNNNLILKWSALPGLERFTTFKYIMSSSTSSIENEVRLAQSEGFAGIKVKFDFLEGSFKSVLRLLQNKNTPLMIEMLGSKKFETFYESLKDARLEIGGNSTPIILNSFEYDSNEDLFWKILEEDNLYVDPSGLEFKNLVSFITSMKSNVSNWSRKILFGTNYPFCKIGDIVKILRYLFSYDFVGNATDLRRIMGANALELIPPRYSSTVGSVEEKCVMAIDEYSEQAAKIFEELLSYYVKRGAIKISSCDFLARSEDGVVDISKYLLTLKSTREEENGITVLFMKSRGGKTRDALALAVLSPKTLSGFKNKTIESVGSNENLKNLLRQAHFIASDSEVKKVSELITEALHKTKTIEGDELKIYTLSASSLSEKVVGINPKDMQALGLNDYDVIIIEPIATGDWYAALVKSFEYVSLGDLQVNEELMNDWYVFEGDKVKIEKYTGKLYLLRQVDFAVESSEEMKLPEFLVKIKDKMDVLYEKLDGLYIGKDMRLILSMLFLDTPTIIRPVYFQPELEDKKLGIIKKGKTIINFVSKKLVKPYNLLLVIDVSEIMKESEVPIEGFEKMADLFVTLDANQVEKFEKQIYDGKIRKNSAAALIGISCLKNLSEQSNLNKASVISYSNQSSLFTILEKTKVIPYMDFSSNRKSFSLKVLSSHIIDKCQYPEGKADLKEVGNKVKEFTEKIGGKIPTLIVIITSLEKAEKFEIFQEIADKDPKTKFALVQIGRTENDSALRKAVESIKGKYIPIRKIDHQTLEIDLASMLIDLL